MADHRVYVEAHGEGLYHDDPDCEYLFSPHEVSLAWALKRDRPACECVEDNH